MELHVQIFFIFYEKIWIEPFFKHRNKLAIHSLALVWQQNSSLSPCASCHSWACPIKDGSVRTEGEAERRAVSFGLSCHVSRLEAGLVGFVLVLNKPIGRCSAPLQPISNPTAANFRSSLLLFCIFFRLRDAQGSQTSHFFCPISVSFNACAPRRAYVRGRGSRETLRSRARGRSVSYFCAVCLSEPAGHVQVISTRYQTTYYSEILHRPAWSCKQWRFVEETEYLRFLRNWKKWIWKSYEYYALA